MPSYTLSIHLKFNQIEIILYRDKEKVKKVSWIDKQDLDQKLLRKLDKILKRSKIKITDLKREINPAPFQWAYNSNSVKERQKLKRCGIKFSAEKNTSITAKNIAEATVKSLNFALNLF